MITAVVMSAFLAMGTGKGDTLSTIRLAGDVQKFYNPPAILLSPDNDLDIEGIIIPRMIGSHSGSRGLKADESNTLQNGRKDSAGGIKRSNEGLRPKN